MTPTLFRTACLSVMLIPGILTAAETETVHIVTGSNPLSSLEQLAVEELESELTELFQVEVKVEEQLSNEGSPAIIIGTATNQSLFGDGSKYKLSELGAQTQLLKSVESNGNTSLVIAGGSPVATLWAVYEYGYQNGIRSLMQTDVYPPHPPEFKLTGYDLKLEPQLQRRAFELGGKHLASFQSWSAEDCEALINQLSKLKFNHIQLNIEAYQPYVHYEVEGIARSTAYLNPLQDFELDPEMPGSTRFVDQPDFQNLDFAEAETYEEKMAAGKAYVDSLTEAAHARGMTFGISYSPVEFPVEFKSLLPNPVPVIDAPELLVTKGSTDSKDHNLLKLTRAQYDAIIKTYPDVDEIVNRAPGHAYMSDGKPLKDNQFSKLLKVADEMKSILTPDSVSLFETQLMAMDVLENSQDKKDFRDPSFKKPDFMLGNLHPAFISISEKRGKDFFGCYYRILPSPFQTAKAVAALNEIEASGNKAEEANLPAAYLQLNLTDPKSEPVPQMPTVHLAAILKQLEARPWQGISVNLTIPAELDSTLNYLSRRGFDASITPHEAHHEFFRTITGEEAASERMWIGYEHIREGVDLIDENSQHFSELGPDLFERIYTPAETPEWWADLMEHFTQSDIELYRSHDPVKTSGRKELYYYAKRSEYVLDYLTFIDKLHAAATAEKEGDLEAAVELLYEAQESLYNGIDTLGDVARNPSDLGLIFVLNRDAYAPLMQKIEELEEKLDAEQ
ncbi:MAG: alpha-glucuronidase family glycosyl hydrolase [Planctomycetaceae bacterium]